MIAQRLLASWSSHKVLTKLSARSFPGWPQTSQVRKDSSAVIPIRRRWLQHKHRDHAAATVLNYFAYNLIKIHRTLRKSLAMAAGVTDLLWKVFDLVALWESYVQRRAERAA